MYILPRAVAALSIAGLALGAGSAFGQTLAPDQAPDASLIPVAMDHMDQMDHICPQYLVRLCVIKHFQEPVWAWTNPCLAREKHWTIVPNHECPKFPDKY